MRFTLVESNEAPVELQTGSGPSGTRTRKTGKSGKNDGILDGETASCQRRDMRY